MPASRSRRPSSASCSTTTATNVLVALPMFHATSGSTGPDAGSTVAVPAVTSVMAPSRSRQGDAGADELTGAAVGLEDVLQHGVAWLSGAVAVDGDAPAATDEGGPGDEDEPGDQPDGGGQPADGGGVSVHTDDREPVAPPHRRPAGRTVGDPASASRRTHRRGRPPGGRRDWCRQTEPGETAPALVGEDHELDAVAGVELAPAGAHVGLHRRLGRPTARRRSRRSDAPRATSDAAPRARGSVSTSERGVAPGRGRAGGRTFAPAAG